MNKNELHNYISSDQKNICQTAASINGAMVYSDTFNNYKNTDACHIASATKSITSLLIGIAIDKGLIISTNQKVLDFFPDYHVKRGEKTIHQVTLRHLMTMTAPYKYKSEPWTKVCTSDNWTRAVLDLLGGRAGITGEFKYSTLGMQILSAVITKVSGMTTTDFANRYLFEPLGTAPRKSFTVSNKDEHLRFVTSESPKDNIWFCDSQGIAAAGFGLCLSAEDMLKIGQLCLDDGVFNGRRIVSSGWIHEITSAKTAAGERFGNMAYGLLWWIPNKERSAYAAIGDSGNVIYVDPDKNIVITVASSFKPAVSDRVGFIQKYIEPFIETLSQ
ncbi:MAG: serine hydrolase [Oscillospiraceae bacterium]|nr:serine hydrolase [Oscillospiraceae bacterium]